MAIGIVVVVLDKIVEMREFFVVCVDIHLVEEVATIHFQKFICRNATFFY